MVQLIIIVVIIISLVAGFYSIILLGAMRKNNKPPFLNSFFYYQILFSLFGLYGILGNIAVQQILLKFDLKDSNIGAIALFFPFFGVPLIVAAWYMLIKLSSELINRKTHQSIAIAYFVLATTAFLVYGRYMQNMSHIDYQSFTRKVILVFYLIDLIVSAYLAIVLSFQSFKEKINSNRIFLLRFGIIAILLAGLRASALHFAYYHWIIGLYYLLLFFAGNLSIILLTKVYLANCNEDYRPDVEIESDIYQKYGISNREKDIIREICKGKTNQQIADELFISLQTVKDHTYNIFRKVNVKNRVQLSKIFNY